MPHILSFDDLKEALSAIYSRETLNRSKETRMFNIIAFSNIHRSGLVYASLENRMLLYETLRGEKVFIQYPGKESASNNRNPMPNDFRPKLQCDKGLLMQDASFGLIWDILEEIGKEHRRYLCLIAALFFRMGYMYDYVKKCEKYARSAIMFAKDSKERISKIGFIDLPWYCIELSDDIWFSLNNYIGDIEISSEQSISFEAFVKFIDLLLQNEDCKYYYRNMTQGNNRNYNLRSGRTSTCDANLLVLYYLQENCGISYILDSFQKSRGVPPFRKSEYNIVTDGIVVQR